MSNQSKQLGIIGEQLCESWLEKKRWEILAKNWRYQRLGEIDLIAYNPVTQTLHFIEVKTRTNRRFSHPAEAIDSKKQQQIIKLADIYLTTQAENLPNFQRVSLDALLIVCEDRNNPMHSSLEWIENAWNCD